jgi:hypothetical protein
MYTESAAAAAKLSSGVSLVHSVLQQQGQMVHILLSDYSGLGQIIDARA